MELLPSRMKLKSALVMGLRLFKGRARARFRVRLGLGLGLGLGIGLGYMHHLSIQSLHAPPKHPVTTCTT